MIGLAVGMDSLPTILAAAAAVVLVVLLATRYRRVPHGKLLVVYGNVGKGRAFVTVEGGGRMVWPLIQDSAYLDLGRRKVELGSEVAMPHGLPNAFTVAIGKSPEIRDNAVERLLGLGPDEVRAMVTEIIAGQLQKLGKSLSGKSEADRNAAVRQALGSELGRIGLVLLD